MTEELYCNDYDPMHSESHPTYMDQEEWQPFTEDPFWKPGRSHKCASDSISTSDESPTHQHHDREQWLQDECMAVTPAHIREQQDVMGLDNAAGDGVNTKSGSGHGAGSGMAIETVEPSEPILAHTAVGGIHIQLQYPKQVATLLGTDFWRWLRSYR